MQRGESGLVELELRDRPVLLAHAPLSTVGWNLGLVAPVDEIAARSAAVTTAIQQDAAATLQSTMLVLVAFFLVALLVIATISRRLIVRRVAALASGTRAIATGDLTVRVVPQGKDELGQLALSFNEMAGQLTAARDELEDRVAQRTRELAALFDVTAVASASLDLEEVLNQSLVRVVTVMNGRNGSIHLLDEAQQRIKLAATHNVPPAVLSQIEDVPVGGAVVGRVVQHDEPLYVPVIAHDAASVPAAGRELAQNSFLGAPMRAKGKTIGVLSIVGKANRQFSQEEIALIAAIGDQVGVAVENARLYQQAEALAVVEERQRLARELHDAVTQSIYSATLLAATGRRAVAAGDWPEAANFLERLQTITGQALKELRLLVYELRPSALENAGLVEALQHRLDAVEQRAGIQAQLLVDDVPLDEAQETALYRVVVEALNNALKHAEATAVTVRLIAQNDHVTLVIEDNGRGFDLQTAGQRGGIGLHSMRERVVQMGGKLTIESERGGGTAVTVMLPNLQKQTLLGDWRLEIEENE
jgi:nitrate/nitrite-specific signal transduction histidine kinase